MDKKYKFLIEKPADSDEFIGGSHQRIAESVYDTLISNNQINVVGIEGELGSGKSTVIELIKLQGKSDGFDFISFDVERFQHGATKKALIETIYNAIKESLNEVDAAKAKKAKAVALGNHLEYSAEVQSHVNGWVVAFIVSLLFAASVFKEALFGLSIFFNYIFAFVGLVDKPLSNYFIDFKAVAAFVVIVIPGLIFLTSLKQWSFFGTKPPQTGDLFKKNSYDKISESFDVTREVGAYELQEALTTFVSLISGIKKYILIIDNIDRVTDDKLREVWSDIDVFKAIAHDKIQLLIPYSHSHVARALCSIDNSVIEGREFISKRLPITFRVSPLVTADWKTHFTRMLNEAIDGISEQHALLSTQLVETLTPDSLKQITPRYLKRIINSVVCTMRIKLDSIHVMSVLFYQLTVVALNTPIEDILNRDKLFLNLGDSDNSSPSQLARGILLLERAIAYVDWPRDIISIHFQAPYKVIESELLVKPLRDALETSNPTPFLNKQGIFGYSHIINNLIIECGTEQFLDLSVKVLKMDDLGDSHSWVQQWLPKINDALPNDTRAINKIKSWIDNCESLILEGFELNVVNIEREFLRLEGHIASLEVKKIGISDMDLFYKFSKIVKKIPNMFNDVDADLYTKYLWPNRGNYNYWNIEDIFLSNCKLHKILGAENGKFDLLLLERIISYYKVDWNEDEQSLALKVDNISEFKLTNSTSVHALNALIISSNWNEESTFDFYISKKEQVKKELKDRWFAHALAHIILNKNYASLPDLEKNITINDNFTIDLANALALHCQFSDLLSALKQQSLVIYVKDAIARLISDDRIYRINVKSCIDAFPFLMLLPLSAESIAGWLSDWSNNYEPTIEDFIKIPNDFIEAVFSCEDLEDWHMCLMAVFSSKEADSAWWTKQILNPSENLRYVFENWLKKNKKMFLGCKNLCSALKTLLTDDNKHLFKDLNDQDWIDTLLSVMPKAYKSGVLQTLSKTLHEFRTAKETQITIFRFFNKYINIFCSESSQSQELAIMLFECFPNEFDDVNLCLDKWSEINLMQLVKLIVEFEDKGVVFLNINKENLVIKYKSIMKDE